MDDERSGGVAGYRIEHHTERGVAVVRHLVNPDPVIIDHVIDRVFAGRLPHRVGRVYLERWPWTPSSARQWST